MKDKGSSQIQWVIEFQGNKPNAHEETPSEGCPLPVKITVPPPSGQQPLLEDMESQLEALESLQQIVKTCREVKEDCQNALEQQQDQDKDEQVHAVSENLRNLFHMIMKFTRILEKIRRPQKDDPDEQ